MEISKNPNPNSKPSSSSVRVLVRSPSSSPTSSDPSASSASNGVVVVGFIGHRADITTNLINRIVDSNVFGSGNSDNSLCADKEELRDTDWFTRMRLSYHRDNLNGILFLHFSSDSGGGFQFGSAIEEEELEFKYLQGMLFMFSVCHVIIYIQDGSRFDNQLLKKFRVLQAAKNGLLPFVRSHITAGLQPNSRSDLASQSSRPTTSAPPPSNNPSLGKNRSLLSRSGASISLMSSLGSNASLFPGQCTPVMLFVFMDDFSDTLNTSSNVEELTDRSASQNQSSSSGLSRPNLPAKVSSPVVVLSRPVNKSEGGFRKKLQSSMEAQIRFLIKRCRTLSGSETSNGGPRSGGVASSSVPLFSLDSSRAVVLLDRSVNRRGESLEYATRLVEDVLNGKATSDSLLLESHGQMADKEDFTSVKDFIYRQSDILRGRGAMVANSNSGSAGGVGMVAVAAAAAAAAASASASAAAAASALFSAASGKTSTAPELPNAEVWLSSSQIILNGIISAKGGCLGEIEISKRKPRPRIAIPPTSEAVASKAKDPLDVAVSWLESGKGLNTRFSISWCERTLPAAKEVYLKDLPACYPTSMHEAHLEKALHAFHSMVKGPAVQQFAQKLEDECTAIWKSGRQQCDAVSLTGKSCMHQIHDLQTGESISGSGGKPHCSGYVFLHACACGRSRKLRLDPFDFESANNTSCYADCDKLLPALQLPNSTDAGPVQPSSWRLIHVGGPKYYEPSKGLLQSGFCVTQKFLSKWEIYVENRKSQNGFMVVPECQGSGVKSLNRDPKFEPEVVTDKISTIDLQSYSEEVHSGAENQTNLSKNVKLDEKIFNFGKGLPNFTMRKPFAEVVAGSATGDSGFPPLQKKKQHSSSLDRNNIKQSKTRDLSLEHTADHQGSQKSSPDILNGINAHSSTNGNPYLRIGSNVVPVSQNSGEKIIKNPLFRHLTVYVGFEHECPHGHRFLLNPEHLNELGNLYQLPEESQFSSSVDISDQGLVNPSKLNNNIRRGKVNQISNRANVNGTRKERNGDRSKEVVANSYPTLDRGPEFTGHDKEQNHISFGISKQDLHGSLGRICIDDSGQAFSLLNRNLPIYMNCPHCKSSKNSKELQKVKFAGTISQLQRIFVVTPPYPIVLATCPLIQFEASCLHPSISKHEQKMQFSLGNEVVLPPESFLTLRLPFVYGVETEGRGVQSLKYFEHQPEATAWIMKGTTLRMVSRINNNAGQHRSQKHS